MKKKVNKNNIISNSSKGPFNFNAFKTIRSFGDSIYSGKITINEADQEQANLLGYTLNFNAKARPKNKDDKRNKIFMRVEN